MTFTRSVVATACAAVATFAAPVLALAQPDSPRLREAAAASAPPAFGPDISLILQGSYRRGSSIPETHVTGFFPGGHAHGGARGVSLGHSELVLSGNVDPYFRGYAALALAPEGGIEVEEAWVQTLGLGSGAGVKAGRFLSGVGPVAQALSLRLGEIDPAGAGHYADRYRVFAARLQQALHRWETEAAPLRGLPVLVHHRNLSYLAAWLGLEVVADLEPKPGIEPSAAHLAELLGRLRSRPARMVLRTAYQPGRASEWIARQMGIQAVVLPYTIGGSAGAKDLFSLFDDTIARLKDGLQ